jgi:hypothetical protein
MLAKCFGSSDAQLNPAVTMGFAVLSGQFAKLAPYIVVQVAGAFVGAARPWGRASPTRHFQLPQGPFGLELRDHAGAGATPWGHSGGYGSPSHRYLADNSTRESACLRLSYRRVKAHSQGIPMEVWPFIRTKQPRKRPS